MVQPTACFTVTEARRLQQPDFDLPDTSPAQVLDSTRLRFYRYSVLDILTSDIEVLPIQVFCLRYRFK